MSDLGEYIKLLRTTWPLAIPAATTAVLAILSDAIKPKYPSLLPGGVWFLLTAVCLFAAQYLVWLQSCQLPIPAAHEEALRKLT